MKKERITIKRSKQNYQLKKEFKVLKMVKTENEDTEFRNCSKTEESLFFIRRGRLRILISIDKSRQDISIDKEVQPGISDMDLQALISMMENEKASQINWQT